MLNFVLLRNYNYGKGSEDESDIFLDTILCFGMYAGVVLYRHCAFYGKKDKEDK